ncbi:ATPase MORC2-like [Pristis pectinata]|uniref:ATPase MORC2-like n=1 Tax=Pristis pectinata TaxID=685728 RepID=UPI00223E34FF|nr:ATPase MORC2-like [Pristis pectinata]
MADKYHELSRAQLTCDYLHANSTTHEFLFGALAELVDNARDARATQLNIYTEMNEQLKGGLMLCFLDDGVGMDPNEAADIIHLGKSVKRTSGSPFSGQYGNGLKSGAMRIGTDFILFTKKNNTMTCILISRTFYEREGIDEVIVPVPSWYVGTQESIKTDDQKFSLEMTLIYKYSPFNTEFDVMQQFHKITGSSGTLVIIYNLKLNDDGEPELDIETDPSDILLTGLVRNEIQPERYSFRAYTTILYIDPRMKIFIQGQRVRAKPLFFSLYRPRKYTYFSRGFKIRALREVKEAELAVKVAEEKMQEAKFQMRELEMICDNSLEAQNRLKLANALTKLSESQSDVDRKKKLYQEKLRALKKTNNLTFIFGVNIEKRNCDGMFIYNNSRLIKMYKKIGVQLNRTLSSCGGVVGVVNVPSVMMEPTHNKQDFADAREYHNLLRIMGQFLLQYWKDLGLAQTGIVKFWNEFGYVSTNWNLLPSNALQYRRRRAVEIQVKVQCDLCLRWRTLPSNLDVNDRVLPNIWVCSMNQNPQQNRCDIPEQLPQIPLGTLNARSLLSNEKQELLDKSIQRHWEKAASLQFQKTFPTEPLMHRLPSELSNKFISKGITVSESNLFPLSSRKRQIPAFQAPHYTRSNSSERVAFSRNKRCRKSSCQKVTRIRGKVRPTVMRSEKQSYTSVHSAEEKSITISLMIPVHVCDKDPTSSSTQLLYALREKFEEAAPIFSRKCDQQGSGIGAENAEGGDTANTNQRETEVLSESRGTVIEPESYRM